MKAKIFCIVCLVILGLGHGIWADEAQESEGIVRAKIGIKLQSGEEIRRAKAIDRVNTGDLLWIYVIPEPDPAYVYVVHSDQYLVTRLNDQEHTKIVKGLLLKLPAKEGFYYTDDEIFYSIDGRSAQEYITVICSPVELPEIDQLLQTQDVTYTKWLEFEEELIQKSKIDLRDIVAKPWIIAGTTRGMDSFPEKLQIFSGNSLVVKKYEFRVKR